MSDPKLSFQADFCDDKQNLFSTDYYTVYLISHVKELVMLRFRISAKLGWIRIKWLSEDYAVTEGLLER